MKKKLTLSIDGIVLSNAKHYATIENRSLSQIIENYLKLLAAKKVKVDDDLATKKVKADDDIAPEILKLKGVIKEQKHIDYKETLVNELSKKHGSA